MEDRTRRLIFDILGVFFLIWGIVAIALSMYEQQVQQIFYLCYTGLLMIGIGFLTKRSFIVMSQIYILAIPLLFWTIDFTYWLLLKEPLFGLTDYFFVNNGFNIGKFISLQHLFTVPLSIYAVSFMGKKEDYAGAWKLSFVHVTLIFLAVLLFSPAEANINCVFEPCINVAFGLPYRLVWFIVVFGMTLITSFIVNKFILRN